MPLPQPEGYAETPCWVCGVVVDNENQWSMMGLAVHAATVEVAERLVNAFVNCGITGGLPVRFVAVAWGACSCHRPAEKPGPVKLMKSPGGHVVGGIAYPTPAAGPTSPNPSDSVIH